MSSSLGSAGASGPQTRSRSLPFLATLAGAYAALGTLVAAMAIGVLGWFITDGAVHGTPRDGLRSGALAWLVAHGSGVSIDGVRVAAVPLGLTLICTWVVWRTALRLGENLATHGPDADALADGDRDWTVPTGVGLFAAGYVVVATAAAVLAATESTNPSLGRTIGAALLLTVVVGGVAVSVGSGRAAMWLPRVPEPVRHTVRSAGATLVWLLGTATLVFVIALLIDFDAAANVFSEMHTDTGDALLVAALTLTLVPNAIAFAGSYLLGPGFAVGTATLVSPTVVAIGPVPLFPLLAALPDNGETPAWTPALVAVPVLVAAVAAYRCQRRFPTAAWDHGALRGAGGGVVAGLGFAVLAGVSGGAVGPGRMAEVGPFTGEVLFAAMVSLGLGGLLGGVLATWLFRRTLPGPASYVGTGA